MKTLIAEDDFVSRKVLHKMLASKGECDITVDGAEVLEAYFSALDSGQRYDLVCLDILMPKLNGIDVLKKIREEEERRGIVGLSGAKIIMTTGLDQSKDVLDAFKSGCEAYIVKPIEPDKLWKTISKLGLS